jgi:hypothetical protein
MSSAARWVGVLVGLELADGRYHPVREVELGVDASGLVTARTRDELERGDVLEPSSSRWRRVRRVFYRRARPGFSARLWKHAVSSTVAQSAPGGLTVFRHVGAAPARICPMSGDFICEG